MQQTHVNQLLDSLKPISLDEMDGVKLLNRVDSKYIIPARRLPGIFRLLGDQYSILEIEGRRSFNYVTTYFDTPDYQFYRDHHNRLAGRIKVRSRTYKESNLHFFEVKMKNNNRTKKYREKLNAQHTELSDKQRQKINSLYHKIKPLSTNDLAKSLSPALLNTYSRITLVNKAKTERCTIDLNLAFQTPDAKGNEINVDDIAIIELKQSKTSLVNGIAAKLRSLHIPQSSISKYVLGLIRLHPEIKHNTFKPLLLNLERMNNQ